MISTPDMNSETFLREYVEDAYDLISRQFDKTRAYMWKRTQEFLNVIPKDANIVDIGCGNGKNIIYLKNLGYENIKGCDISQAQTDICIGKQLNVIKADNLKLPYNDNEFDFVISVAVVHHFHTFDLRKTAINELIRICKPYGKILIQVWGDNAIGTSVDKKIIINDNNDVLIPWHNTDGELKAQRYYHLFKQGELENHIDMQKVTLRESYEERCNYGVILLKN